MENSNLELFLNGESTFQNAKVDKSSRFREVHMERSPYAHSFADATNWNLLQKSAKLSSSTLSLTLLMLIIYFERKLKKCADRLERTREKSAHAQFGGRRCIPRFYNVKKHTFTYKLLAPIYTEKDVYSYIHTGPQLYTPPPNCTHGGP